MQQNITKMVRIIFNDYMLRGSLERIKKFSSMAQFDGYQTWYTEHLSAKNLHQGILQAAFDAFDHVKCFLHFGG